MSAPSPRSKRRLRSGWLLGLLIAITSAATTLSAADIVTFGPTQAHAQSRGFQPVVLPELQWLVYAPYDVLGTTVRFSAGPFLHTQHPEYAADCRLTIRLVRAAGPSQWHIVVPSESTSIAHQDSAAVIVATSSGPGAAVIGLQPTFVPPPGRTVPAGEYVTQVVGLVTGL